jgi:sarcosine oxidase subunit gamma
MQAILTRTGPDAFEVMVFRSMARTAWAELTEALEVLAARAKVS